MRLWKVFALGLLTFGIGFLSGDIYGGYATGFIASLFFVLTGFGISQGASLVAWLRSYYSVPRIIHDEKALWNDNKEYLLRFRKKGAEGIAEGCEGRIVIGGDETTITIWEDAGDPREVNIRDFKDLKLFRILEPDGTSWKERTVVFYSAAKGGGAVQNQRPFNELKNAEIRVTVTARIGRAPEPFTKSISEIMSTAIRQHAG